MTVIDLTHTIGRLSALSDESFRQVVDRDLRRTAQQQLDNARKTGADEATLSDLQRQVEAAAEESEALRSPALVDRWLMSLVQTSKSVEGQLSARREDFEAVRARCRRELSDAQSGLADLEPGTPEFAQQNETIRQIENKLLEAREKYARSRSGTIRFKSGLDEWIVEARSIRDSLRDRLYDTVVVEERNRLAERVRALEDAIRTHRENFPDEDEPSKHDEVLWSFLLD